MPRSTAAVNVQLNAQFPNPDFLVQMLIISERLGAEGGITICIEEVYPYPLGPN